MTIIHVGRWPLHVGRCDIHTNVHVYHYVIQKHYSDSRSTRQILSR